MPCKERLYPIMSLQQITTEQVHLTHSGSPSSENVTNQQLFREEVKTNNMNCWV